MERYIQRRKGLLENRRQEKTERIVKANLSAPQWPDTG